MLIKDQLIVLIIVWCRMPVIYMAPLMDLIADPPEDTTIAEDWYQTALQDSSKYALEQNMFFSWARRVAVHLIHLIEQPTGTLYSAIADNFQSSKVNKEHGTKDKRKKKPKPLGNAHSHLSLGPFGNVAFNFGFTVNAQAGGNLAFSRLYGFAGGSVVKGNETSVGRSMKESETKISNIIVVAGN